ncbi:unnamed protein product [Prunus armeniaca]
MFVCILMFFALSLIGFCFVFVYGVKEILTKKPTIVFLWHRFPRFLFFSVCIFLSRIRNINGHLCFDFELHYRIYLVQAQNLLVLFFRLSVVSFPNAIERRLVAISAFYASSGLNFSYIS